MRASDQSGAGAACHRLTCEMFSGVHDASRHTIESHVEDMLFTKSTWVI